jgi:hypothetical protein
VDLKELDMIEWGVNYPGEFIDQFKDYELLMKDSAPWN